MPRTTRLLPLLIALLGVAALLTPLTLARAVAPPAQSVTSGADFATTAWQDPWDFSNSSDMLLDRGPSQGLVNPAIGGGMLSFAISRSGYASPLWAGYPGALPIGRDGAIAANKLNAATYTRLHMRIYVSAYVAVGLSWSTCLGMGGTCSGGMTFGLQAGWNDVDRKIAPTSSSGARWSGMLAGLRLALTAPSGSANVRIDTMRIYQPTAAGQLTWASPDSTSAKLWWTDVAGSLTTSEGQHAGVVSSAVPSSSSGHPVATNVSGYPPRTYFWSVSGSGAKVYLGQTVPQPIPVIDSPGVAGCQDYATSHLGHPWTFTSAGRLAGRGNVSGLTFTSAGVLGATNAAPQRNDPWINLPIARGGIDGRVYHRLTVVESYDGAFNLASAPGGGSMARVLWQQPGHLALSQTNDLVTYSGKRTLSVDMAMPASKLTEPEGTAAQRYPFASTSPVTRLRYDPNEDPGARRWHLFSVRLAADCSAHYSFPVTWHDLQYTLGSTVRIDARSAGGHVYRLGTGTEHSGANALTVSLRALPAGSYRVVVTVTNGSGATTSVAATGPLVVLR